MYTGIFQSIRKAYDKLGKTLYHLEMMKKAEVDQSVVNTAMLQAEAEGERLTLLLRSLPTYSPKSCALDQVDEIMKEMIPIKAEYTEEGWFKLTIPYLLPKKEGGGCEYLRRPLYLTMQEFFNDKAVEKVSNGVIVYRHIYDKDRPERRMRDHDNIETNAVSDVIAMYLLRSDSPVCCSHFETSDVGDHEETQVFVLNQHEFPAWIVKYKGEMLYQNTTSRFRLNRKKQAAKENHYGVRK